MTKKANFYDRLMQLLEKEGIANLKALSKILEYNSAEKLYRLERDKSAKPSYDILYDLSNKFENWDMTWLISGKATFAKSSSETELAEPEAGYTGEMTMEARIAMEVVKQIGPTIKSIETTVGINGINIDKMYSLVQKLKETK